MCPLNESAGGTLGPGDPTAAELAIAATDAAHADTAAATTCRPTDAPIILSPPFRAITIVAEPIGRMTQTPAKGRKVPSSCRDGV
jgi:hypothetical protein